MAESGRRGSRDEFSLFDSSLREVHEVMTLAPDVRGSLIGNFEKITSDSGYHT